MTSICRLIVVLVLITGCAKSPDILTLPSPHSQLSGAAFAPNLSSDPFGRPLLSWIQTQAEQATLYYATWDGTAWAEPQAVASGSDWFVNWADFPSVRAFENGLWAAHWLVKSADATYAYDVHVALSFDSGDTWTESVVPHNDGTPTEHGFVSLYPVAEAVGVLWLDGRQTVGQTSHDSHDLHEADDVGKPASGMTLRSAVIGRDGIVRERMLVDDLVCDCCQTDVAVSSAGIVAVYRDRSPTEQRDIYASRMLNSNWSQPQPVASDDWTINGCPVNGPSIVADQDRVTVAWFTAAGGRPRVSVGQSMDAGQTFDAPIRLDEGGALGRVATVYDHAGQAWVAWLQESEAGAGQIVIRKASAAEASPIIPIAETTPQRQSGFPQLLRWREGLMLAFTDAQQAESAIQVRYFEISQ